ncbi:autotransporter assembly complex protein TamA [Psychromarinibacter sp. C21-152]|uniref:Autotransporter assembly complex protein TamA n=1 Tax=Psychromarinibacter sediminicola TaxID=3033385 RepID=A0AAE3NQW1_9RHOB|nr:autotransporter assembly complex family protein [Psychromarinibacter sediminicola]MDF0600432.1 autotransporter assembly complex protein TamA [Psychromarinibacter sediminicola]
MKLTVVFRRLSAAILAIAVISGPAAALDRIRIHVSGTNEALQETLIEASLVVAAKREGRTQPETVFAAALSDYARLLDALYAEGYYGGVVHVYVDGREAAEIPLLRAPDTIREVAINVAPGPPFRFGEARIAPLPPGTELPERFRSGARARAPVVRNAVEAGIDGWRAAGYAKARTAGERVSADHRTATLDSVVALNPGPVARFGSLVIETPSAVRAAAIRRIAGLPEGERFSPAAMERVADRLRRTGAFASVSLKEAETLGPGGEMDILLSVADQKPRRFGFGAELSSLEGLTVSGFWMHRNIFGGAERLRFDAEVANIGGEYGTDFRLGARLETPAPFGPDTRAFAFVGLERLDEPDFLSDQVELGFGVGRRFGDSIETELGLSYLYSQTEDDFGNRTFSLLKLPASGIYDTRDDTLDPTEGFYLEAEVTPFLGLNDGTGSGVRTYGDARAYYGLGPERRFVLAGRVQVGSVAGAAIGAVHPDLLFYSGGAGTVRGQPYQSLDVDHGGGTESGGRSFIGLSAEFRARISERFGAVVFADAGYVGAESFYDGSGAWHSGAGAGLRYLTGIGPIRFDVAAPVGGNTGDGVQFYLGIGQAF